MHGDTGVGGIAGGCGGMGGGGNGFCPGGYGTGDGGDDGGVDGNGGKYGGEGSSRHMQMHQSLSAQYELPAVVGLVHLYTYVEWLAA
jgi:hypothetical protein